MGGKCYVETCVSLEFQLPTMVEIVELLHSSLGSNSGGFDICLWDLLPISVEIQHKFQDRKLGCQNYFKDIDLKFNAIIHCSESGILFRIFIQIL